MLRGCVEEIEKNDFKLNISRYVSTARPEEPIDLQVLNKALNDAEKKNGAAPQRHNAFLAELGLPPLP